MSQEELNMDGLEIPIDGLQAVGVDAERGEIVIEYLVEVEMQGAAVPARLRFSSSASARLVHAITEMVSEGTIRIEEGAPLILQ